MSKPDSSVLLDIQGVCVEITAPAALCSIARDLLGGAATLVDGGSEPALRFRHEHDADGCHHFVRSDGTTATGNDPYSAVATLVDHLHTAVANRSTVGVFVHAGVFAFDDRLVVVPGRSHAGKSSLVAAAVERGATYFSDEYAIVDPSGRVHPYARPIALRTPSGPRHINIGHDVGGTVGSHPCVAAVVLVTEYRAGARWEPTTLTGASAALPIIANTVHARRQAKSTIAAAAALVETAVVLSGPRGEATDLLDGLQDLLASLPRRPIDASLEGAP